MGINEAYDTIKSQLAIGIDIVNLPSPDIPKSSSVMYAVLYGEPTKRETYKRARPGSNFFQQTISFLVRQEVLERTQDNKYKLKMSKEESIKFLSQNPSEFIDFGE